MSLGCALVFLGCGGTTPSPQPAPRATAAPALPPLHVEVTEIDLTEEDAEAERNAQSIAENVAELRAGKHGALPPLRKSAATEPDAWPTVTARNATRHGLIAWFSGPCPRTIVLAPGAEIVAELCEGTYDIAAELSAKDFLPFVGEGDELRAGVAYEITFYVMVEPRVRARRGRR